MDNQNPQKFDEMPVLDLIRKIKEGVVDPKLLPKATRQLCVEALVIEGGHISQIAGLFKISERTIRRDMVDIRGKNSVAASPELTRELVGELLTNARHQGSSLKRIARLSEACPDEKTQAEFFAWKVGKELIDVLYHIGFLVAVDQQRLDVTEKKEEADYLTPRQKEIQEIYLALPPMDREKLLEKLLREMTTMEEQMEEENRKDIGPGSEEVK